MGTILNGLRFFITGHFNQADAFCFVILWKFRLRPNETIEWKLVQILGVVDKLEQVCMSDLVHFNEHIQK